MIGRPARRIARAAATGGVIGGVIVVLAACTSGTDRAKTTPAGPTRAAATSSAATRGCPSAAGYCDTFDGVGPGWAVENEPHFFAGYSTYLGGTYRVGERVGAIVSEPAPADVAAISTGYGIRLDVDAVPDATMPAGASFGLSCWEHPARDARNVAAFVFLVSATTTRIGRWSDIDGAYHDIVTAPTPGGPTIGGRANHVTATCVRSRSGAAAVARLAISVNGVRAAATTYAGHGGADGWSVGRHVGLLAAGRGADVFYDNFALTALTGR